MITAVTHVFVDDDSDEDSDEDTVSTDDDDNAKKKLQHCWRCTSRIVKISFDLKSVSILRLNGEVVFLISKYWLS